MGGVFPVNKAQKVYFGGVSDFPPEKVFCGGDLIWERPFGSVTPARLADTNDNILLVGSSDMGCLIGATWSPNGSSDWHTTFRNDYNGSNNPLVENLNQAGINMAVTYGRVDINTIMTNAENGQYGIANPLTHMGDYDILVMDTSDVMYSNMSSAFPAAPSDLTVTQMARPYSWDGRPDMQDWLNTEMMHKMRLIRLANTEGVKQFWLTSPWPRLPHMDSVITQGDFDAWEARAYDPIRRSMEWQQDRLNAQCLQEGLGITVKLIPFDILFKRFGEDVRAGLVPGITDARQIRANSNNLANEASQPVMEIGFTKHWYMLNYAGNYMINCLFAWLAHGKDPRGFPRTDARYTLTAELATYMQNLAYEVGSTYPRGGRTVNPDPLTNRMPKLRNIDSPSELIPDILALHVENAVADQTYNYTNGSQQIPYALYCFRVDPSLVPTDNELLDLVNLIGSGVYRTNLTRNHVNGWMSMSTYNDGYTGSLLTFGSFTISASMGIQYIVMEAFMNVTGSIRQPILGEYQSLFVLNTDVDPHVFGPASTRSGIGNNTTTAVTSPTNRLVFSATTGWSLLEAIVCNDIPSEHDRYNLMRMLTRKHQLEYGVELLWPDLVE